MNDVKGIVLNVTTLNDSDAILNVLSENGKISIKAKGILKINSKNAIYCQVGSYSYFHLIERMNQQVFLLKNAENIQRFKVQDDLIRQSIFQCMLEIFNKSDVELDVALTYISLLENGKHPLCCYALLLSECMKRSGIMLVVDECVRCESTTSLCGLSLSSGGLVCLKCFDEKTDHKLSSSKLKDIRYCIHAQTKDYKILEETTNIDFEIIHYFVLFLHEYGEFTIKSHAFFETLQPLGSVK